MLSGTMNSVKGSWRRKPSVLELQAVQSENNIFGTWVTVDSNNDVLYEGRSRLDCRQWACSHIDGNEWEVTRLKVEE